MPPFSRLVRFLAKDGTIYYGDAILPSGAASNLARATSARVIRGGHPLSDPGAVVTDEVAEIGTLLSPLAPEHIPTVRCLGLNYAKHAREAKMPEPANPIIFYKPVTAVAGPTEDVQVPIICQAEPGLDYETELVIVIGKACRDVGTAAALNHVAGYAVGNDVSHRHWQLKKGGGQWGLGKGFDKWAPFGPGIVSRELLPKGAKGLKIRTRVNGETRQDSDTGDLIFPVEEIVAFLSQGTTLMPGDIIFTGTPEGVGMGMDPPKFLKDGDVVESELEGVGICTNKFVYVGAKTKL